jgi:putative restriction endonuclease
MTFMRAWVAVTDVNWYRFLLAKPELPLVNFWKPSGASFHTVREGEYVFFKAKKPISEIVGGGVYGGYAVSRLIEAWHMLGEANGAQTLDDLQRLIKKGPDDLIGCTFIHQPVFFAEHKSYPVPPDWHSNLQTGKRYEMSDPRYAAYFAGLMQCIPHPAVEITPDDDDPVFGTPHLSPTRLYQNEFHLKVSTAYHDRCAITGSRIRPALQAAHILPVGKGGKNRTVNGLLLRSDVHAMFDGGYLGVDPGYHLRVSPRLRDEFGNGEQFYAKAGEVVALPDHQADQPHPGFLEWHMDTVFRTS